MSPSASPSLRVDPLRGWGTIVAPRRAERPFDPAVDPSGEARDSREAGRDCPFCPGGEGELDEILQQLAPVEAGDPWGPRAVRNLYPFLDRSSAGGPERPSPTAHGLAVQGEQEVLIDTPRHGGGGSALTFAEQLASLRLWRDRTAASHVEAPAAEVHLFRNVGRAAGSSRSHPHAQLVRSQTPTPGRQGLLARLRSHHQGTGECLVCQLGEVEPVAKERTVLTTDHFVVRTLWAPLDPGHLRILPRRHGASLANATEEELTDLAELLTRLLTAIRTALDAPDWNLMVHDTGSQAEPALHWHIEVRPRQGRGAGFEQSAQLGVCGGDPVATAERLRAALSPLADDQE